MRKPILFRSFLGAMAALLSVVPSAQVQAAPAKAAPTNNQILDKILAGVKPGQKFVKIDDMLMPVEKVRAYRNKSGGNRTASGNRTTSSAFERHTTYWPNGIVPYVIDGSLQPAQRTLFIEGAREWESIARLKFIPRTTETDYVRVFRDAGDPNYSFVGKIGGVQDLSLGIYSNRAVAEHEIAHALGVIHEQSRSNRDTFVSIDFSNIVAGQENNFAIVEDSDNHGTYDFDSVMHYGQFDFAKDSSKPTIITKPGYTQFQNVMGQRDHLSVNDKQGMIDIYGGATPIVRPSNDLFSKAKVIEGSSGTVTGTNVSATHEVGEDNHAQGGGSASIWYRWRPVNRGTVTFTTKGSAIDTVLGVYLGLSVSTVTEVTSNDDVASNTTPADTTSSVTFPAQAGAIYYIAVDNSSKSGGTGDITLNWNQNVEATRIKLSGFVKTKTSQPLSSATITLTGTSSDNNLTSITVKTSKTGEYSFSNLVAGNYNLRASKAGYTFSPSTLKVKLSKTSTGNNFTATLTPTALLPQMSVSDLSIREGNAGDAFVTFTVSMSAPSKDAITVNYTTVNGTATSSSDYAATRGTLNFAPNVLSQTVNVKVRPDTQIESDETFSLSISGAAGANIVNKLGTATLLNDDAAAPTPAPSSSSPSARSAKIAVPTRLALLDSRLK
ncbi:Carboxypeptidase regulatory-like domain-containing protein [Abditibacterium utsteinense]|uniref:Carboxypeptidase regulatory-like domain-containing protein n=1 Tax=Abditibacterium utsteinense TaxID=1960156 RepID=A0A2S8SV91_9BACT|nr:M12 family metallopeptidase [Abditibacterium utsteinense]PQV64728.1 Carboxypeptidase regulatory-like domain-containing protein [Abditibacterium utsteinense]